MTTNERSNKRYLLLVLCLFLILLFLLLKCCSDGTSTSESVAADLGDSIAVQNEIGGDSSSDLSDLSEKIENNDDEEMVDNPNSDVNSSIDLQSKPKEDTPNTQVDDSFFDDSQNTDNTEKIPATPAPFHKYNKESLAIDLMHFTPKINPSQRTKLREKLQYAFNSNAIIRGELSDGTDEYKLKNYLTHLRATGPYDIEIFNIERDEQGRVLFIELKETQINNEEFKPIVKVKPPPPYDYNNKNLAADLMHFTPSINPSQETKLIDRLQYAFDSNAIITGDFLDRTDEYSLKNYLTHLRTTDPYKIEVFNIEKDEEGRVLFIELKETQINIKPRPVTAPAPKPQLPPPPHFYSKKGLAGDFMRLADLQSNNIVNLKERVEDAFALNATISGEFSDGTSQYKLKNYISHLRTTGPYIVEIYDMKKNEEGKIVSIQLRETQVD